MNKKINLIQKFLIKNNFSFYLVTNSDIHLNESPNIEQKDIFNSEDIKLLVDKFYCKVREDELLAIIFNSKIKDQWPQHLEKMYRFWQTVALAKNNYKGNPFLPHANLPVQAKHFNRWLKLFFETVDELFDGNNASRVKCQAQRMAEMFQSRIKYYNGNSAIPII